MMLSNIHVLSNRFLTSSHRSVFNRVSSIEAFKNVSVFAISGRARRSVQLDSWVYVPFGESSQLIIPACLLPLIYSQFSPTLGRVLICKRLQFNFLGSDIKTKKNTLNYLII